MEDKSIGMIGEKKEVLEKLNEFRETHGDITLSELIDKLKYLIG